MKAFCREVDRDRRWGEEGDERNASATRGQLEEAKQRREVILLNKNRILFGNRIKLSIFDIDVIHR